MKCLIILFIYAFINSSIVFGQEANDEKTKKETNVDDASIEFKETKFLQVDKVQIPNELKMIEEQIKQNIIDVILVSQTHTPVYIQRRDGYTENYKKFFGLQVNISPSQAKNDYFDIGYFYYNWTTNKFDKSLFKRISKYNVINELRYGVYEILFGKDYVKKNRDAIDLQNYERIQAVRKSIAQQKKLDEKKKKEDQRKQDELKESEEASSKKKKILRENKEKKSKQSEFNNLEEDTDEEASLDQETEDSEITEKDQENSSFEKREISEPKNARKKETKKKNQKNSNNQKNIQNSDENNNQDPILDDPIATSKMKHRLEMNGYSGMTIMYTESLTSDKKIKAFSNFKYVTLGAQLEIIQEIINPIGYTVDFIFGIPILKQNYEIPIYKKLDLSIDKYDFFINKSKWSIGIQYAPINFVNVPSFGQEFQVFENDFLWAKLQFKLQYLKYDFAFSYYLSILGQSSQQNSFSGQKYSAKLGRFFDTRLGAEIKGEIGSLNGDLQVSYGLLALNLIYHFEN